MELLLRNGFVTYQRTAKMLLNSKQAA